MVSYRVDQKNIRLKITQKSCMNAYHIYVSIFREILLTFFRLLHMICSSYIDFIQDLKLPIFSYQPVQYMKM